MNHYLKLRDYWNKVSPNFANTLKDLALSFDSILKTEFDRIDHEYSCRLTEIQDVIKAQTKFNEEENCQKKIEEIDLGFCFKSYCERLQREIEILKEVEDHMISHVEKTASIYLNFVKRFDVRCAGNLKRFMEAPQCYVHQELKEQLSLLEAFDCSEFSYKEEFVTEQTDLNVLTEIKKNIDLKERSSLSQNKILVMTGKKANDSSSSLSLSTSSRMDFNQLSHIELSNLQIRNDQAFSKLQLIKSLIIVKCNIAQDFFSLCRFPQLSELKLEDCGLTNTFFPKLHNFAMNCPNLSKLSVSNNKLSTFNLHPDSEFNSFVFSSLKLLNLSNNKFITFPTSVCFYRKFPSISFVDLSKNMIQSKPSIMNNKSIFSIFMQNPFVMTSLLYRNSSVSDLEQNLQNGNNRENWIDHLDLSGFNSDVIKTKSSMAFNNTDQYKLRFVYQYQELTKDASFRNSNIIEPLIIPNQARFIFGVYRRSQNIIEITSPDLELTTTQDATENLLKFLVDGSQAQFESLKEVETLEFTGKVVPYSNYIMIERRKIEVSVRSSSFIERNHMHINFQVCLKSLNLSNNKLTRSSFDKFFNSNMRSMFNLKTLDLSSNLLSDHFFEESIITSIPSLESINLSSNLVSASVPGILLEFSKKTHLCRARALKISLSGNPIENKMLAIFKEKKSTITNNSKRRETFESHSSIQTSATTYSSNHQAYISSVLEELLSAFRNFQVKFYFHYISEQLIY